MQDCRQRLPLRPFVEHRRWRQGEDITEGDVAIWTWRGDDPRGTATGGGTSEHSLAHSTKTSSSAMTSWVMSMVSAAFTRLTPPIRISGRDGVNFCGQNLLGDLHPMMDIVIARLTADDKLGIVFAHDPHLLDWDSNQEIAEGLAARMGMKEPLPPFFDFPVGTMFWARTAALKPLFNLKLGWSDYPEEPLPNDGTILHALERLLPFVAQHAGYRLACNPRSRRDLVADRARGLQKRGV